MRKFISIHCLCHANVTIMRNFWHGKTDKFPIERTYCNKNKNADIKLVRKTFFWNTLQQVRSKLKDWKAE